MLLGLRYKFKLYRRFEIDIKGNIHQYFKKTPVGRFIRMLVKTKVKRIRFRKKRRRFVYRIDIVNPRRQFRKTEEEFVKMKRVKLFYLFLTHNQIRKYDNKARVKSDYVVGQFLRFMECRASVLVFRLNLVDTMYDSRRFLSCGLFLLNGQGVLHPNHVVKLQEWMSIPINWHDFFRSRLIVRLNRHSWFGPWIYFNVPRYIWFDFSIWIFLISRCPQIEDIVFPICCLDYKRLKTYWRFNSMSGVGSKTINVFRGTSYN